MSDKENKKWLEIQNIINDECLKHDVIWKKRQRVLNTKIIILLIFKLILNKKNQGLPSCLCEFWNKCEENDIELPQKKAISASSFCEARQKVPENIFKVLSKKILNHSPKDNLWKGHNVFAVDGSRVNLPRRLKDYDFPIYDADRRHYPQGLLSCLYNVLNKTVHDFDFVSHMNERTCAIEHLKSISSSDIVLFDRGYFSYLLLHSCIQSGVHPIFRLQLGTVNKQISTFNDSGKTDEIIDYIPSTTVLHDLKKQGYILQKQPLKMRLIKVFINGEPYIFGTTLLDQERYKANDFSALYHERWMIEELYKISKNIMEIENFHSKTERGIRQEIYAHLLLINISRFCEQQANEKLPPMNKEDSKKLEEDKVYKLFNSKSMFNINFKNCLITVARQLEVLVLSTGAAIKNCFSKMIEQISRVRQKIRPKRSYPRISHKPQRKWQIKGHSINAYH